MKAFRNAVANALEIAGGCLALATVELADAIRSAPRRVRFPPGGGRCTCGVDPDEGACDACVRRAHAVGRGERNGGRVKFCQSHWDKLRQGITDRGLWQFVATSGEGVFAKLVAESEKGLETSNFDPLMYASMALVSSVMSGTPVGLELMVDNADGSPRCPICYVQKEHDKNCTDTGCEPYETWIGLAADAALAKAKSLGMVGAS